MNWSGKKRDCLEDANSLKDLDSWSLSFQESSFNLDDEVATLSLKGRVFIVYFLIVFADLQLVKFIQM